MNKQESTMTQRRVLVLLAGVGVVLGLSVSAFLASINGSDKSIAADAPRQTIEVKTPTQVTTTPDATTDSITPAPIQESDGATAKVTTTTSPTPKQTPKVNQTVVDSSTRVTVKPKPVATPTQETQPTKPGATTPAAPQQKSPTEGYIRPQVSLLGATSCTKSNDGWVLTLSWKVSGGNFFGLYYGKMSGLKTTQDSWVISVSEEVTSSEAPTGQHTFRTEGDTLEFLSMNDQRDIIDVIRFADRTTATVTGLCR